MKAWRCIRIIMITSMICAATLLLQSIAIAVNITSIRMMSELMFDSFIVYALSAGIALALVVGPLGSVVVWRRMAYFGDTLAHAALLGVALAVAAEKLPMAGVGLIGVLIAMLLDKNPASIGLLQKFGFKEWGRMPGIARIDDQTADHLYYGLEL